MSVYLQDADVTLYQGDVVDVLRELPSESVHMCCTSPPFYGLRDYGTGTWEGGEVEGCDHLMPPGGGTQASGLANYDNGLNQDTIDAKVEQRRQAYPQLCGKCGAHRVDQQIGLEATPDEWVARLVEVFREVRRVLRDDGTLWVEIGDSYNATRTRASFGDQGKNEQGAHGMERPLVPGCKTKDLIGAPWLLAFALRADGWYLRSEIIWAKPNPMPESVTDRPTTSHSRVFLLAKSPRYFYDADAIREPNVSPEQAEHTARYAKVYAAYDDHTADLRQPNNSNHKGIHARGGNTVGRNRRSVWDIATQPYPEAHFATWPEALVRPMVLAGTSEKGVCPVCGAPWQRLTESELVKSPVHGAGSTVRSRHEDDPNGWAGETYPRLDKKVTTTGWMPTCAHNAESVPATVLDPFAGSGTTSHVARKLGRWSIGIDLNSDYLELAAKRLQQQSLFA